MWSDRIEQLRKLREARPRDPFGYVAAAELVRGDCLEFGGDWFRVLCTEPENEPHVTMTGARGGYTTVVDYLGFEQVKVKMPRPEGLS